MSIVHKKVLTTMTYFLSLATVDLNGKNLRFGKRKKCHFKFKKYTPKKIAFATVAQSVERRLGKAEVTGPIPVSSSTQDGFIPFFFVKMVF